ncbi:hypothetical protein AAHE18_08G090400 [Arachis hypogaea]
MAALEQRRRNPRSGGRGLVATAAWNTAPLLGGDLDSRIRFLSLCWPLDGDGSKEDDERGRRWLLVVVALPLATLAAERAWWEAERRLGSDDWRGFDGGAPRGSTNGDDGPDGDERRGRADGG